MIKVSDDGYIEVSGTSGKLVTKHITDLDKNPKLKEGLRSGFLIYVSRWYRLPEEYTTLTEAKNDMMEYILQYDRFNLRKQDENYDKKRNRLLPLG